MRRSRLRTAIAVAALAALHPACGGGGAGGGLFGGGIGGTGIVKVAQGPITAFGSIFVGGVEYETGTAQVTINGTPASEAELREGMRVDVRGTQTVSGATTAVAGTVAFRSDVGGPVQSVNVAASSLVVMGQTVQVDGLTVFDGTTLATVAVGNIVEASGPRSAAGVIRASRVELKSAAFVPGATRLRVRGTVAGVNPAAQTFTIGALTVSYAGAMLQDLPGGAPANGIFVEVATSQNLVGGALIAATVEGEATGLGLADGEEAEIEGLITRFASAQDFDVSGQRVRTNAGTRFEDGTAADLALNVKVEAEGTADATGAIVAEKIKIDRESNVELKASVTAVNVPAGVVTVLGIPFVVDASTQLRDDSEAELRPFTIADLRVGDRVEVQGATVGAAVIAEQLERKEPESEVELRGPVTSAASPNLNVLGATIVTDASTEFDGDEGAGAAAAFFAAIRPGDVIQAKGREVAGTLRAEEIERGDD